MKPIDLNQYHYICEEHLSDGYVVLHNKLNYSECPVCNQEIDEGDYEKLEEKYDDLCSSYDGLEDENEDLQRKNDNLKQEIREQKQEIDFLKNEIKDLINENIELKKTPENYA